MDHFKDSDLSNDHEQKPSEQVEQRRGVALKGLVLTGTVKAKRPTISQVKRGGWSTGVRQSRSGCLGGWLTVL